MGAGLCKEGEGVLRQSLFVPFERVPARCLPVAGSANRTSGQCICINPCQTHQEAACAATTAGIGPGQERGRKRRPGALRPALGIKGCAWAVARDDQMQAGIDAPTMLRHDQRVTLHTHGDREGGLARSRAGIPFSRARVFF